MFFKKKVVYGLQAVLYLSELDNGIILSAKDIAAKLSIPKEFVSKVLQALTRNGIILSKKGKGGGFSLGKSPDEIRLIDVIRDLDSNLEMDKCLMGFNDCNPESTCPLHNSFDKLKSEFRDMLINYSLTDLQHYHLAGSHK